jgi:hypothetical protein
MRPIEIIFVSLFIVFVGHAYYELCKAIDDYKNDK